MGRDIVKAEDGVLVITRIVTNVNTFYVRDGRVAVNLEATSAGLPSMPFDRISPTSSSALRRAFLIAANGIR